MTRFANYEYHEKIGQGAFGEIYKGRNIKTDEEVVVKMEPLHANSAATTFSALKHESNILNILYSKHCRNIPPTYWYGTVPAPPRRVLVMPFYEESLDTAPIKDHTMVLNIMRSAISILDHIHDKYVVHRDIKPANFMIHNNELILIDFGLAAFYVDSDEKHILPTSDSTKKRHIIGTPKYASWNIHCGEEYSRRDDLMSVVYIGLFLLYGASLWVNTSIINTEDPCLLSHPRNQWFKMQKTQENIMILSSRFNTLQIFARYVYGLSFQERPSYKKYIELFDKTI
jgi:serine/threonine protein kinase